jgi:hypothetical protein
MADCERFANAVNISRLRNCGLICSDASLLALKLNGTRRSKFAAASEDKRSIQATKN